MEQAERLVGMAREQATTQVASQKDRAAESLGVLGSALHEASRQLRDQDGGPIAGYVDTAASQVDTLASMLREQDIAQLVDTTARFARREPVLFLTAAFALGFVGTRFLRSSAPSRGSQGWQSGSSEHSPASDGADGFGSEKSSSRTGGGSDSGRSKGMNDREGVGVGAGSVSGGAWGAHANASSGAEG